MPQKEWQDKNAAIVRRVITHPLFLQAKEIYCYVDYQKEVSTKAIIEQAWLSGKRVAVPRINDCWMEFYYLTEFSQLEKGFCGILEPKNCQKANDRHPLMIMPGAVFDLQCHRIGYGGGFYDKYLETHTDCITMALAFAFQVEKAIPFETYDICPNMIITEEGIIHESKITK